ncbi:MAG: hypothetical protein RL007_812 [Bacteroidota bacterium]|jgi:hypothetical protein
MKRILTLILILIASAAIKAAVYPGLTEVVTKFYTDYSVRQMKRGEAIQYQKKREGWFVVLAEYNETTHDYETKEAELYWSATSGKYKLLKSFELGYTRSSQSRISDDLRAANQYDFERCSYYGYDGWDKDVITDFASYKGNNDTIYESLARAYSNYASGFTGRHYSYHSELPANFSEKQKQDEYLRNERLAIEVYDGIRKRNPNFKVLVGSIYTKYCNEIMATYDDLLYMGREKEIADYFKEDLYDPFMRSVALNMLESAERNGIIFTNGDNDSYPLWYMQWIKGVRTDVAVMNISLMSTEYYLKRHRGNFFDIPPVKFSIADSTYARESYFLMDYEQDRIDLSPEKFLSGITTKGSDHQQFFSNCRIVVNCPAEMYKKYPLLSTEDSALITIDRSYLIQGEMAMLDIILSNFQNRPVYISSSAGIPSYLKQYMFLEGLVCRFIPARERTNNCTLAWNYPIASVTPSKTNLSKLFLSDTTIADRFNGKMWTTNIKISAIYTAEMMCHQGEKSEAIKLLNSTYSFTASFGLAPLDAYALEVYYDTGDKKKGDEFGTALIDSYEKELKLLDGKSVLTEEDKELKSRTKLALKMCKETFDKQQRPAQSSRVQKILDWY